MEEKSHGRSVPAAGRAVRPPAGRRRSLELIPNNGASLVPCIAELERGYTYCNGTFFAGRLPRDVVLLVGPRGRARTLRGRFTPGCWQARGNGAQRRGEILIAADHEDMEPLEVVHTLLHAMVHLWNEIQEVPDCNHNGYHNKRFKDEAERRGLVVGRWEPRRGYGRTSLAPPTRRLLQTKLRPDPQKLALYRLLPPPKKAPTLFRRFACECPKSIYAQRDDAGARCVHCDRPYVRVQKRKRRR